MEMLYPCLSSNKELQEWIIKEYNRLLQDNYDRLLQYGWAELIGCCTSPQSVGYTLKKLASSKEDIGPARLQVITSCLLQCIKYSVLDDSKQALSNVIQGNFSSSVLMLTLASQHCEKNQSVSAVLSSELSLGLTVALWKSGDVAKATKRLTKSSRAKDGNNLEGTRFFEITTSIVAVQVDMLSKRWDESRRVLESCCSRLAAHILQWFKPGKFSSEPVELVCFCLQMLSECQLNLSNSHLASYCRNEALRLSRRFLEQNSIIYCYLEQQSSQGSMIDHSAKQVKKLRYERITTLLTDITLRLSLAKRQVSTNCDRAAYKVPGVATNEISEELERLFVDEDVVMLPPQRPMKLAQAIKLKEKVINEIGATIIRRKLLKLSEQHVTNNTTIQRRMSECKTVENTIESVKKGQQELSSNRGFVERIKKHLMYVQSCKNRLIHTKIKLIYLVYSALKKLAAGRIFVHKYLRRQIINERTRFLSIEYTNGNLTIHSYPITQSFQQCSYLKQQASAQISGFLQLVSGETLNKYLQLASFMHALRTLRIRVAYFIARLTATVRKKRSPGTVRYQRTVVKVGQKQLSHQYLILVRWNMNPTDSWTSFERIDTRSCHPFLDLKFSWECLGICTLYFSSRITTLVGNYWYSGRLNTIVKIQRAIRIFLGVPRRQSISTFWSLIVQNEYLVSSFAVQPDRFIFVVESICDPVDRWRHYNNNGHLISKDGINDVNLVECQSAEEIGRAVHSHVLLKIVQKVSTKMKVVIASRRFRQVRRGEYWRKFPTLHPTTKQPILLFLRMKPSSSRFHLLQLFSCSVGFSLNLVTTISKSEFSHVIEHQNQLGQLFRLNEYGGVKKLFSLQKLSISHLNNSGFLEMVAQVDKSRSEGKRADEPHEHVPKKRRNGRHGSALQWVRNRKKSSTILF